MEKTSLLQLPTRMEETIIHLILQVLEGLSAPSNGPASRFSPTRAVSVMMLPAFYLGQNGAGMEDEDIILARLRFPLPSYIDPNDFDPFDLAPTPFGMAELKGREVRKVEQWVFREIIRKLGIEEKYCEKLHDEINRFVREEGPKEYQELLDYATKLKALFGK
jgi:hypothetical protein